MVSKMSASAQKVTVVPVSLGGLVLRERSRRDAQLVVLRPAVAVGPDLDGDPAGQGVHDGDTDAVQTAGDRVAAAAELAARVQHGQHDLDGRLALGRDDAHRDAAAVVDDAHAAVGEDRDVDGVRVTGQRLVDGVVDDLLHEVVQTTLTGRADVHAGSLADRVQTLEDGDGAGVVRGGDLAVHGARLDVRAGVGGRDVLVGVAGIGHEAPFLAQHKPISRAGWPERLRRVALVSLSQRCTPFPGGPLQWGGIGSQSTGSADSEWGFAGT